MFTSKEISLLENHLKNRIPLDGSLVQNHVGSDMEANDLNGGEARAYLKRHKGVREASVLVPLVERDEGYFVLLTQRTDHLPDHPGQVSFPGGSREPTDKDHIATALRETNEEVGIPPEKIEILGQLNNYNTVTGFCVSPVVGIVSPDFSIKIDEYEVAEVFEVPLSHFLIQKNHERHSREFQGMRRYFFAMPYNDYYIWGATAAMLVNLAYALKAYIAIEEK